MSETNPVIRKVTTAVAASTRATRVVYVLAYRAPDYIRSQSLLNALGNCADIELLVAHNRSKGIARYFETLRALYQLRRTHSPDIFVLGFRGHEIFWPVRWLARGKPLVFDALMSPSASLREENKAGLLGRIAAPLLHRLERRILQRADLVLTDTKQHAAFYATQFGLPIDRILAIPVGAIETTASVGKPDTPIKTDALFSVLFYGSMLPLHGIEVIVAAAAKLEHLSMQFDFIGGNARQVRRLHDLCKLHGVTHYTHRTWVPLDALVATEIPRADLCLGGPFGDTPQAGRVITSKTSQALAQGKAALIGAIDEDIGLIDKENCLLVTRGNPNALADALQWAYLHRKELRQIGERGRMLYEQKLSLRTIVRRLCPTLRDLIVTSSIQS